MSNATNEPRNPGNKRRRRSRGGQNRHNQTQRGGPSNRRNEQAPRAEEFRPQGGERKARRQSPPPQLTWWQKLKKALGLYKEPVRPPRKRSEASPRPPKSNVRNARSSDARTSDPATEPKSEARGGRKGRGRGERPQREQRGGDSSTVESSRVYVGNLSYDVTEQDLQDLFRGVGPVRSVEVVYNRSTHRSKGYGFVEMLHIDEAKQAVTTLHDQFFMGRKMTVSGAKSKGQDERDEPSERSTPQRVVVAPTNPRAAQEPTAEETPAAETPAAETPAAETPVAETPVAETPVAETPVAETPTAETPAAEAPEAEAPVEASSGPEADSADDHESGKERAV